MLTLVDMSVLLVHVIRAIASNSQYMVKKIHLLTTRIMWKTCINKEQVFKNASTVHTVCDCGAVHHVHLCFQTSETDFHFFWML